MSKGHVVCFAGWFVLLIQVHLKGSRLTSHQTLVLSVFVLLLFLVVQFQLELQPSKQTGNAPRDTLPNVGITGEKKQLPSRLLRLDLKLFGAGGRWASFLGGRLVALLGLNKPPRTMEERKKNNKHEFGGYSPPIDFMEAWFHLRPNQGASGWSGV